MGRGGIATYMMNYYRHIDKSKLQIDFIVHGFERGAFDDEIESMGGKIFRIPVKSKDYFGNINALKKIFTEGNYKIIHSHLDAMNAVVLKTAKSCGIPVRIAHSHNTQHLINGKLHFLINEMARFNHNKYATHYFACSRPAADWLFGKKIVKSNKVNYIKNAIDLDKNRFSINHREKIRKELNIENEFVIGHVGRFDHQKNHFFLLECFSKVIDEKPNSKLILVGDGHLKTQIQEKIQDLKLIDKVILLGSIDNVHEVMNAFDVFFLPSKFEGLGIVLIEAQCNGLNCVTSEEVPKEADITGETTYIGLNEGQEVWAKSLIENIKEAELRNIEPKQFITAGYSITKEAEELQELYLNLLK